MFQLKFTAENWSHYGCPQIGDVLEHPDSQIGRLKITDRQISYDYEAELRDEEVVTSALVWAMIA